MSVKIEKDLVLRIFCLARQAERSVDFSLRSPWESFRQYYTDSRIQSLENVLDLLPPITQKAERRITGDLIAGLTVFRVLSLPLRALLNRLRKSWRFRPIEVQFITQVFHNVIDTIRSPEKPDPRDLVQLRMDLYDCERLIEFKLFGLPILQKAADVEHFCQAYHIRPVKLEEICQGDIRQPSATRQPVQERLP